MTNQKPNWQSPLHNRTQAAAALEGAFVAAMAGWLEAALEEEWGNPCGRACSNTPFWEPTILSANSRNPPSNRMVQMVAMAAAWKGATMWYKTDCMWRSSRLFCRWSCADLNGSRIFPHLSNEWLLLLGLKQQRSK
mmetsp:Transcript_122107/g.304757  ORF Transcript_122107/g.304757 Transcript_122107/m.304757 type:complete len:136 (+) Transcript_122107:979-1386(+)